MGKIINYPNKPSGFICTPPIYEYEGWVFEFGHTCFPWPLRKDMEPRKRAGKKFYSAFGEWFNLREEERGKYRIGGGCQRF